MSPTPNSATADLQQANADLQRQLAEARAERDESEAQKAAITEVLGVINSSPGDLAPVFDAMLEKAMRLCAAAFGYLETYDGEHFHPVATRGLPAAYADYLPQRDAPGSSSSYAQILGGAPYVHVADLREGEAYHTSPLRQALVDLGGARSSILVALRREDVLLGSLVIYRREVRPFSEKEIALLQNFAAQAVIAMENARLLTETREALEQQTATAEVLQVINSSPGDLAPVFDAILEKAHTLCGAAYGVMVIREGEGVRTVAANGEPAFVEAMQQFGPMRPPDGSGAARLLRGEQIVHIADFQAESFLENAPPQLRRVSELGRIRTVAMVPLLKDDAIIGFITAFRQEVVPFSDKQIALLQSFATQAVIAIENARLINETREALEQQTATAEVLQVINSSPGDLAPVFEAILEKALRLCGAAFGAMDITDGQLLRPVAVHGLPPAYTEFLKDNPRQPGQQGIAARIRGGEPFVHIVDLTDDDLYRNGDPQRRAMVDLGGARSTLAVPLRKDGDLLGGIQIYRQEVRPFSDKQIILLRNFAAQAVIAMENARLLTETREALEQQTATAEILQVINSSPGDLKPVFDAILEKAHTLCGAAFGGLAIFDRGQFRAVAYHGVTDFTEYVIQPRHNGNTPLEQVVGGEQLVHVADVRTLDAYRDYSAFKSDMDRHNIRTFLVVPLRKDGVLLGAVSAYRREVRPFTDNQIAVLQNFAAQAVIAMENARLITETREALEQQTATAEVLQVINSSPGDLAPVFDAMLEKAMRLCGFDHGSLQTFDGHEFRAVAVRGLPEPLEIRLREGFRPGPQSPMGRLIEGDRFAQIPDLGQVEGAQFAAEYGSRSLLCVPMRKDDKLLGQIVAVRQEVRPFGEKETALLENFAAQAVIAMENARLLGELRQRTDEVAELNRGLEARVAEQVEELGRVGRLKRFLAPQLAELIVSHRDEKILESHRREIVVVFCDLRGYTAFTETAEPEEVLDFLREYHGALGPLVSQFEGTLDQFSGDGIMVFFNDPVPIPDPAERAVRMAVAMREAASELIASWRRRRARVLGLGVGIAQGYATLGQIGFAERSGYTAIGTVCNLAARLCAEAKDGQILLAQRVAVAVEETTPLEEVGELTLKGLTQPVMAYNVPLAVTQPALRVIEGGGPQNV